MSSATPSPTTTSQHPRPRCALNRHLTFLGDHGVGALRPGDQIPVVDRSDHVAVLDHRCCAQPGQAQHGDQLGRRLIRMRYDLVGSDATPMAAPATGGYSTALRITSRTHSGGVAPPGHCPTG